LHFLGKELVPGFGSRLRRKEKIGPQGELHKVGRVVRCEVEHEHNAARGAWGGLTKWHLVGQEQGGFEVELLSRVGSCTELGLKSGSAVQEPRLG
jgi:hypothetical protein